MKGLKTIYETFSIFVPLWQCVGSDLNAKKAAALQQENCINVSNRNGNLFYTRVSLKHFKNK